MLGEISREKGDVFIAISTPFSGCKTNDDKTYPRGEIS
jgi:hypothetical protein